MCRTAHGAGEASRAQRERARMPRTAARNHARAPLLSSADQFCVATLVARPPPALPHRPFPANLEAVHDLVDLASGGKSTRHQQRSVSGSSCLQDKAGKQITLAGGRLPHSHGVARVLHLRAAHLHRVAGGVRGEHVCVGVMVVIAHSGTGEHHAVRITFIVGGAAVSDLGGPGISKTEDDAAAGRRLTACTRERASTPRVARRCRCAGPAPCGRSQAGAAGVRLCPSTGACTAWHAARPHLWCCR